MNDVSARVEKLGVSVMMGAAWLRQRGRMTGMLAAVFFILAGASAWASEPADKRPSEPVSREHIAALIEQLGDNDYFVRERAQKELGEIGAEAFDALVAAENSHADLEVSARAGYLARQIQVEWIVKDDSPEVQRLLSLYQAPDEDNRVEIIKQLAEQPDDQGLAALCRLLRFERSQVLSRRAALAVVSQKVPDDADWTKRRKTILESLGTSPRAPAEWLRTYLAIHDDPAAHVDAWPKHATEEMRVLSQYPHLTDAQVVMDLWRQQVNLLKQLDRPGEAYDTMIQIVELERGGKEALTELLEWLAKEGLWEKLDELASRFDERIQDEPLLLYLLAEARRQQGEEKAAEAAVQRALGLYEGDQVQHLLIGYALQERGLFDWAEGEYRQVINIGPPGEVYTLQAQFLLAEMLHDQLREFDAATVLQDATTAMEAVVNQGRRVDTSRDLRTNRARTHFFFSEHYRLEGDRAQQEEHLDKALEADPFDVDALIGMYRLPDLPEKKFEQLMQRIQAAGTQYRDQIKENPDDNSPYNQLAWLIANTEGDFREALRCSQKSLELKPNEPGHLDTLGRCYYALGDYENAVKYQTQAVKLEPHSGQMNRQLELFQSALAEQRQKNGQADDASADESAGSGTASSDAGQE